MGFLHAFMQLCYGAIRRFKYMGVSTQGRATGYGACPKHHRKNGETMLVC